jgi:methionyl-tRNA formyltransferase
VRIVLCTNGGVHGATVLRRLAACPDIDLAGIVLSTRLLNARYGTLRGAFEHWRRSGLRYALYLARSAAARLPAPGVERLATRDLNASHCVAALRVLSPDLLVSAWFNQRIGPEVTAVPQYGAVNIHPSLLPSFRGVDPVFHARLSDAQAVGVTLHRIAPEFDTGNILAQAVLSTARDESVLRTTRRLFERGADLLVDALGRIAAGDAGEPQRGGGNYDSWPTRAQVQALRHRGVRLV